MKIKSILTNFLFIPGMILILAPGCTGGNGKKSLDQSDYRKAEHMLSAHTSQLVYGADVRPQWIGDDHFWYNNTIPGGSEFIIVDASAMERKKAFDHAELARLLSGESGEDYDAGQLPFRTIEFSEDRESIFFDVNGDSYRYNINENILLKQEGNQADIRNAVLSPDGSKAAFIRDYNLWMRDTDSGRETQLTYDGYRDFSYATNNAGWTRRETPVLLWSPDSRMIATFRHDSRGVGEMYLATTNVGHPEPEIWKYPLPEDSVIFRIHRVVIHLDRPGVVKLKMEPDQHRSTITDHVVSGGQFADVEWSRDGSLLAFVSTSRDHRHVILRMADPYTGEVRNIFEEKEDTFFESGYNMINWHILPETNEFIWYSQQSNWGHLYLHDLETGQLKNSITEGDWKVLQLRHIDREKRRIYFTGAGREPGDPYFQYLYSVNLDGSGFKLHTPDSANHNVSISPGGSFFVDSYSTPVDPPVTVLSSLDDGSVMDLEKADISELLAHGWVPPVPFSVKARDGETDLYGLMHKPSDFDPSKKYPIINYIYPGPQSGSVGSRSFAASRSDRQALAELGFIVVALDAMGTPMRSKSFHETYYGNMGDNGLPDQVAGMKQLAERYKWIDIDRAGIYGSSGGGFASTGAILRYPDFFKVAVSCAGNHDNRNYEDAWGEKWQGLLEEYPDGTSNYDNQANQLQAANLKGKLLLAHGTMDTNVPYYNTLLVVNELIAANKDFDLILFPNRGHGFSNEPYMMRKRWDYFVKHLMGAEPPEEFEFSVISSRGR
ncbi:MAG: DPP IV N-terminal domain-containing protein [Bacteroidales bacterium]|nr:DPP IV N-terminal domain-containing protein [Bacteroidales bacterium]